MANTTLQEEVDRNFSSLQELLPSILPLHRGKFALMRRGEIANYYETWADAYSTGKKFYEDGIFSVQRVTDVPEDLGYFSHAVTLR